MTATTVMDRALAARAVVLADELDAVATPAPPPAGIDLTQPAPDETPAHVRQAAGDALDRGETHYTTRPGIVPLRQAIARRLTDDGFPATADGVVVTNGAAEALYIALQTLLGRGDRLLAAGPLPPNVAAMVRFLGAELVPPPGDAADRPAPSLSAEHVAGSGATLLLIADPSPVSGVALPPADLARLVAAALAAGITVVLDRSLATARYDPALARFPEPDLGGQVVTLGSFSTGHGLAGWRVGWFAAPEAQIPKLRELKQAMSICTTAVSQYAALAALDGPDDWLQARRRRFAQARDTAVTRLTAAGLPTVAPDAYPPLLIDSRALDPDDRRLAARLRDEAGVVVAPGSAFGPATAGFVRIDLGAGDDALAAGLDRIARLAEGGAR